MNDILHEYVEKAKRWLDRNPATFMFRLVRELNVYNVP